jgi:hypothetical protein
VCYVNFRGDLIAKGMDQQTASRLAAHWANRSAGALPKEAMSESATKVPLYAPPAAVLCKAAPDRSFRTNLRWRQFTSSNTDTVGCR